MSKDLLFTGVCSLALVPFADELDDDLIVDIVKDGSAFGVKGRTHKNLMATPAEYGLINWMITRLPLIGITVKGGDTFYIRQSLITPAEQTSFAADVTAMPAVPKVPANSKASRLASRFSIEDETTYQPEAEPIVESTVSPDPNAAPAVPVRGIPKSVVLSDESPKVPANKIASRLALLISIEDDDETVCKPDSEPVTEPTMALDPNMATEVPSEECGTSGDVVMEAAEYSMSP